MTTSVKIQIHTGRQEHSNRIRKEVSALTHASNLKLPGLLFNYDEQGAPIPHKAPPVRWGGGNNGFFLVGIGSEAASVVYDSITQIARHLAHSRGDPLYDIRASEVPLQFLPLDENEGVAIYRVGRPVIAIRNAVQQRFLEADEDGRLAFVQEKLIHSFERQCRDFGINYPSPAIAVLNIGEPDHITSHVTSRRQPVCSLTLDYIDFVCSSHKLQGFWNIGHSLNLGQGGVHRLREKEIDANIKPAQLLKLVGAL